MQTQADLHTTVSGVPVNCIAVDSSAFAVALVKVKLQGMCCLQVDRQVQSCSESWGLLRCRILSADEVTAIRPPLCKLPVVASQVVPPC